MYTDFMIMAILPSFRRGHLGLFLEVIYNSKAIIL